MCEPWLKETQVTLLKDKASNTIWMIIPSFEPAIGGAEIQVKRLSKELLESGHSVRVLTRRHGPTQPRGLPASEVVDGIPVTRLYTRGIGKVGSLLYVLGGLWHLLRHGRRGIYHAHAIGAAGWLAVAARYLLGGRCIVKLRSGRYLYERRCPSGVRRWLFFELLRLMDRVVVVNTEVEEWLAEIGIPAAKTVCIPNSVDTQQFRPATPEEKLAARAELGLPTDCDVVLHVGRLEWIKGVDVLLKAWAALPAKQQEAARLVLVGGGGAHAELEALTASLGLERSVTFAGVRKSVRDWYWAGDLLVLPSRTEGLSNALIEAMACGLPVIASNVGGALDVVEEGKNGVLFEAEDHNQLAQKLASMFAMQDRWAEMGTLARHSVELYADLLPTVGRLREVYRSLL